MNHKPKLHAPLNSTPKYHSDCRIDQKNTCRGSLFSLASSSSASLLAAVEAFEALAFFFCFRRRRRRSVSRDFLGALGLGLAFEARSPFATTPLESARVSAAMFLDVVLGSHESNRRRFGEDKTVFSERV
jgi:hypothetical protein